MTELDMNTGGDETEALARALRGRDPEVIGLLIERYQHRLFRYLLSLTGDRQTAEDVFQETWIRVLERGYQDFRFSLRHALCLPIAQPVSIPWPPSATNRTIGNAANPVFLWSAAMESPLLLFVHRQDTKAALQKRRAYRSLQAQGDWAAIPLQSGDCIAALQTSTIGDNVQSALELPGGGGV